MAKEIDEWLSGYDSLQYVRKKDSLNNRLQIEKDPATRKKIEESLTGLEDDIKAFEELKKKKSVYQTEANKIHLNDSLLQKYSAAKKGIITTKQLKNELSLSSMEKLALSVSQLQAGRFSWLSNPLLSNGATVDGLRLELNPKNFTAGIVAGRLYPVFFWNQLSGFENQQTRYISGVSAGFSFFQKHHLALNSYYMFGKNTDGEHEGNPVAGVEYEGQIQKVNYSAHLFVSQSNVQEQVENVYYVQNVPLVYNYSYQNILSNIISQKKSLYFQTGYAMDCAMKRQGVLFSSDSWQIKYQRVSPFYQSFAAPFLMRDQHNVEVRTLLPLLRNRLEFSPSYLYRQDNLSRLRSATWFWNTMGLGIRMKASSSVRVNSDYRYIQRKSSLGNGTHYQNVNFQLIVQAKSAKLAEQNANGNVFSCSDGSSILSISYQQIWQISPQIEWNVVGTYSEIKSTENKKYYEQVQTGPLIRLKKGEIGARGILLAKSTEEHQIKGYVDAKYFVHKNIEMALETGYGVIQYFVSPELLAQSATPLSLPVNTFASSSFFYGNIRVRWVW